MNEEKEYEFKDFREKQAHFKRVAKERGKFLFVSKIDKNEKGKTYVKPTKRILKNEGGNE